MRLAVAVSVAASHDDAIDPLRETESTSLHDEKRLKQQKVSMRRRFRNEHR